MSLRGGGHGELIWGSDLMRAFRGGWHLGMRKWLVREAARGWVERDSRLMLDRVEYVWERWIKNLSLR